MNRRGFLRAAARGGAVALAAVLGAGVPLARSVVGAGRRLGRIPSDLLSRIRRRTRPFDPDGLHRHHDLAG